MSTAKVAVTIERELLEKIDRMVATGEFRNRSRAVQAALAGLLDQRRGGRRLLAELSKLDPTEERTLAEESLMADLAWPRY